jgi:hypothetical protein
VADVAVTTTDHLPHVSVTFPFTWPGPVSITGASRILPRPSRAGG